jgi:ribosomal protein S18 acetylase RimI-like enzyme
VDVVDGRVRGFVLGSARPDLLKSAVARANPTAVVAGTILGVLRRPTALSWLLKSFKGPDEGSYDHQAPELTYVAVAREARGSGVGGKLVDAFTAAMRKAGIPAYELSVDDDNAGAIAFYEGRSFALVGRYREFGVQHRRYRRETTSVRD